MTPTSTSISEINYFKPSFIFVTDINDVPRSINLANITKLKIGNWPLACSSSKEVKDCILIEVNHLYTVACKEENNAGLLDFLHSLVVKDFRNKTTSTDEMFDEKGGIIW